jgi:hypothetical protein
LLKEGATADAGLQEIGAALSINTVDSFQGRNVMRVHQHDAQQCRERDRVSFRSAPHERSHDAGAQKLVVVGDSATLSQYPFYADFMHYAETHNAYQSAWELMSL